MSCFGRHPGKFGEAGAQGDAHGFGGGVGIGMGAFAGFGDDAVDQAEVRADPAR